MSIYSFTFLLMSADRYTPLSNETITGDDASHNLSIPSGTMMIFVTVEGGNCRYWFDGSTPTSSEGHQILANEKEVFVGINLTDYEIYVPTGAKAQVSYFQ